MPVLFPRPGIRWKIGLGLELGADDYLVKPFICRVAGPRTDHTCAGAGGTETNTLRVADRTLICCADGSLRRRPH